AGILGCPPGSISARLDQARQRLRERLARRGYPVATAGLAGLLAAAAAEAAVPLPLASNTARAAVWFAAEATGGEGFLSAAAVALARGACRATFLHKLKVAAGVLLLSVLLGTGATMLLRAAAPPDTVARARVVEGLDEQLPQGALA